jgi:hypothetical protein
VMSLPRARGQDPGQQVYSVVVSHSFR